MRQVNLVIFFALITLSYILTVEAAGKCVPFSSFSLFVAFSGYNRPVCQSFLQNSGFTHFWVDETKRPEIDPTGELCAGEMAWAFDYGTASVANAFEIDRPTSICQNLFLSYFCWINFKPCNPEVDIVEFISETKMCPWICDFFQTEISKGLRLEESDICSLDDHAWFKENNIDLVELFATNPQIDCTNLDYYSESNDVACSAPTFITPDPVAGRCESYSGSECSSVFASGTQIFVPPGVTQSEMEAGMATTTFVFNSLPPNSDCLTSTYRILCQTIFRECIDIGIKSAPKDSFNGYEDTTTEPLSSNIAYGLKPPLSSCTALVEDCKDTPFFQLETDLSNLDCDGASVFNPSMCFALEANATSRAAGLTAKSVYMFNTKSYFGTYDYERMYFDGFNSTVFYGNTFAASQALSIDAIPFIDCHPPLVYDVSNTATNIYEGRCAFPCPLPIYTDKEREDILIASWVFVMCALIFSGILSLNFIIFKSQRHKKILFFFTLSYFGAAVMLFLALVVRESGSTWDKQCASPTQYEHMEGFGLFQSMFLVYFLLAATAWWTMQAVDLFQRLILAQQYRSGSTAAFRRNLAMHLFCWGMPFICLIAFLVAGQLGYDRFLPFAFITQDHSMNESPIPLQFVFFFAPILALAIITYTLVTIVLIYFIKYDPTGGLKKFQDKLDKDKSFWFKLTQSLKLFGFALLMIFFIILLIVHEVEIAQNLSRWQDALLEWGRLIALIVDDDEPLPALPARLSPQLISLTVFGFCSPGIIMFILYFICSSEIYGLWAGLFYYKLGFTWFKSIAREDTVTGTGSTGSDGSSHGSSTGKKTNTMSTDLLTGGAETALTGRRGPVDSTSNTLSKPDQTSAPNPVVAPGKVKEVQVPKKQETSERRTTLFKGFKSNRVPIESTNSSVSRKDNVELVSMNRSPPSEPLVDSPQAEPLSDQHVVQSHENIIEESEGEHSEGEAE